MLHTNAAKDVPVEDLTGFARGMEDIRHGRHRPLSEIREELRKHPQVYTDLMGGQHVNASELVASEAAQKILSQSTEMMITTAGICAGCGGPHAFDTSVPSAAWNPVIRAKGLIEYLCTTCIIREFAKAGKGFTAALWGEEFNGTLIEVIINGRNAKDADLVSEENNRLRVRIQELES